VSQVDDKKRPLKTKRKIKVLVVTTGRDVRLNLDRDEPMRRVFDKALASVGGQDQPEQFALEYENEVLTELDRPIEDFVAQFGWGDEVELELVPAPEVI